MASLSCGPCGDDCPDEGTRESRQKLLLAHTFPDSISCPPTRSLFFEYPNINHPFANLGIWQFQLAIAKICIEKSNITQPFPTRIDAKKASVRPDFLLKSPFGGTLPPSLFPRRRLELPRIRAILGSDGASPTAVRLWAFPMAFPLNSLVLMAGAARLRTGAVSSGAPRVSLGGNRDRLQA